MRNLLFSLMMCCCVGVHSAELSSYKLDTRVAVVTGNVVVPLGVTVRFADVAARVLPAPARRMTSNGRQSFCYRFAAGEQQSIVLDLFDSESFGMHTAQIGRAPANAVMQCAMLSAKPQIRIGPTSWDIDLPAPDMAVLPASEASTAGFLPKDAGSKGYVGRTWQWKDDGARRSHAVSIIYRPKNRPGAGFDKIQIQNWQEPSQ